MKIKIKHKGKEIFINGIEKCGGLKKYWGLMFKKKEKANAMLFEFKNSGRYAIHSFFCPEFLAVWIGSEGKIAEYKIVKPWKFIIKPKKDFVKLIEIPLNEKYFEIINLFPSEMISK